MNAYGSVRKFVSLVLSIGLALLPTWAQATNYTWDPNADNGVTGGGGTWDTTTTAKWWNGAADILWPNETIVGDVAVFNGAGSTVTISTGATGVTANGLVFNGGGYIIAGTGSEVLTLAGTTPTITVSNGGDTATINAIIAGTTSLTKAGSGTLVLGGANTYSGPTTINAGTVNIAASNNLGDASATNTIAFGGGTLRSTATLDLGTTRAIAVGAGGGALSAQTATTLTVSGALSGSDALTVAGGGTIVLSADNSLFTGNVTVSSIAGNTTNTTLRLANANALTSGTVTVNAGVAATGGNGNQVELAGATIGVGVSLALNSTNATSARSTLFGGSGTSTWNGSIQYIGDGTIALHANTGATLIVNGNVTAGGGGYTGTSFLRGIGAGVLNGTINLPAGSVTKTDTGTWTINSTGNTWLNTGISVGTLKTGIANALPSAAVVTMGQNDVNAATFDLNGFNQTIAGLASNPATGTNANNKIVTSATPATLTINQARNSTFGGMLSGPLTIVKSGAGTLTLANNNTSTGGYTLAGGTLRFQGQNNLVTLGSNGLNATYYNFGSNPGIASTQFAEYLTYLMPRAYTRVDAQTNMPWANNNTNIGTIPVVPVPGFAIAQNGGIYDGFMWKGLLNITTAGSYQFKGTNDDNLTLYIDGVQVGTLGVVTVLSNIGSAQTLTAGSHSIVIKQTQSAGGGFATVRYNGPDTASADVFLGAVAGTVTTGSLDPLALGPVAMTASSTLDLLNDATTSSLNLGNGTLTITSQTLNTLVAAGGTITAATPTIAVQNNSLTITGPVGQSSAGLGLTLSGPGITELKGANTYTGTTSVTGGQLRLNTTGANALSGNLTINSANANGEIANVRMVQSNQIIDTALLTMTQGILDMGANNETVGTVAINGGRIIGSGTLTVNSLGTSTLTAGEISTVLAGSGGLTKTGTGTLLLRGANTYTGVTAINAGTVKLAGGTLGATGIGNDTTIGGSGLLHITNANLAGETVTSAIDAGVRVSGGTATLGNLTYSPTATSPVLTIDAGGELVLNTAITSSATVVKNGAGTLTFNYDVGSSLPGNVNHLGGVLGFNGTQSFGFTIMPVNLAYKFNSDPGSTVNLYDGSGNTVIAGFAAADQLIPRINALSDGALALGVDSSAALNFSTRSGLSLGAVGRRIFTGTITPGTAGYRLGGGGGELVVATTLGGANNVTINQAGTVSFRDTQTFTGAIAVDGSGRLRMYNNDELGNATNTVVLTNGGTLELVGNLNNSANTGSLFQQVGNPVANSTGTIGQRVISIGSGGGTINAVSYSQWGTTYTIAGTNGLIGNGDLSVNGYGDVWLVGNSSYSGNLTINHGSRLQVRASGKLPSISSVTVNQSGELVIHNNGGVGTRQFLEASDANRIIDTAAITLAGGALHFRGNDAVATNEIEAVGTVTLNVGRNQIQVEKGGGTNTQGAQLTIANLVRNLGGGVLNTAGTVGTSPLGTPTGDAPRIVPTLINGVAPPASTTNGMTLPWALINSTDFAAISVTGLNGIAIGPSTNQAAGTGFTPVATTRYNFATTAASQTLTLAAGNQQLAGFRFTGNNATPSLLFAATTDTLYVVDGVIISDNNNQTRTIGSATVPGKLTTGGSAAAAGGKELFFHANQGTVAVESVVTDNNGAVTVHKGVGSGILELRAANTYSGGTIVHQGRINAIVAGSLGSGPVTVKGSAIELRAKGTTSSTSGFTVSDRSELYLQNTGIAYDQPGDRFTLVGEGNTLTGGTTATFGLNSLTRVTSITGGGQVIIPSGTHIRTMNAPNGVVDINMPANLGTDADMYFNIGGGGGAAQSITVGAGTPWKGLGSATSGSGWTQGTVLANSDFTIQGLNRLGANVNYPLGANGDNTRGGYTIVNLAGKPINAYIDGLVSMNEDAPITLPSDLTFVVMPGGYLSPNISNQFGAADLGYTRASVLVQGGGTVDPGPFVPTGANANQATGRPYPIPSPVNTNATFEAGGRLLLNDGAGAGSTTGGATWTMKADSILHLATTGAFLGSNAGLINNNQIVYEQGAIVRLETDRVFRLDHGINNQTGGQGVILELYNGNRNVTDYVDLFNAGGTGVTTVVRQVITLGAGGGITNDSLDRTFSERRGHLILNNGATLSATSQTTLSMDESFTIAAGATINIGADVIDGNPKNGIVQFQYTNSKAGGVGSTVNVVNGGSLSFNANHVFPDITALNLAAPVNFAATAGTTTPYIGNGSSLLLNQGDYLEIIGPLTGDGGVFANAGDNNTAIGVGWGATSNFTFNGVFGTNSTYTDRSPSLIKVGSTRMDLTNTSVTPMNATTNSPGSLGVFQGELALSGANGKWTGGELRVGKSGTLILDNSVTAITDRQTATGNGNRWVTTLGGGDLRLLGHATAVADVALFGLGNSATAGGFGQPGGNTGGYGTVTILPAGDLSTLRTSLTFGQVENFQSAGERNSTWLLRGAGMAGLPGTFSSAGVYTANAGNPKDGLLFITSPNFVSLGNSYGQNGGAGGIHGAPGTPIVPTSGLLLGATSPTATEGEFVTIDAPSGATRTSARILQASEYTNSLNRTLNFTTGLNVNATGALNAVGDTRFQVIKMSNGSSLSTSGTLFNLTQPSQILIAAGGILVPTGASATLNASLNGAAPDSIIRTPGGVSAYVHAFGNLTVNGEFFSDTGLVKTGPGTATFNAGSLNNLRGRIAVHDGTLNLNDTVVSVRNTASSAVSFSYPHLELNGGTVNINGNNESFGRLEAGNFLPGAATEGGTLTTTTAATVSISDGGTFSGHITGAISLNKFGNNTLLLSNTNSLSGPITVRQGTLLVRDSGTLPNVTNIDLFFGRLDVDNGYLSGQSNRLKIGVDLNMRGGDFINRGRPETLTQETVGTVNLLQGNNLFQTISGGAGATETYIGNLVRSNGATVGFLQNNGFVGTAGNDTSAIRYFPTLINGTAPTLVNNILPAWIVVNGDHFATYQAGKGISYLSNTEDGFATYESTDLSTATTVQNVNDGTSRTIAASKSVNAIRFNGGATFTINAGQTLTVGSGGIISNTNNAHGFATGSLTSGSSELYISVQQNTMTISSAITGAISLVKLGSGTVTLTGANNYTGITYANSGTGGGSSPGGTLNLNTTGANGTTVVAIPGDLVINGTTVTVGVAGSIANTSNVTINGGGILNMRDATSTTETLASLTFGFVGGDANNRGSVSRANAQATSALNLTAATPITSNNDNPVSTPTLSVNLGTVNFTRGAGLAQTLQLNSPVSTNGLSAAALLINAAIGTVPTGVTEGGLIKAGNGLLVLGGASTFGSPASATEVFNIQSGYVMISASGALGASGNAITTVQSGATLLLNSGTGISGSVRLKNGSRMGATINGSLLGAVGSTGFLDIPSGATVQIDAFDSLIPSSNTGNVTVNHLLTGSGTINQVGTEYAQGYAGGGFLTIRNTGSTFSGTFNVGTNAVLEANPNDADLSGNTLGTATINLNGGSLRARDQADNTTAAQTITYGNNVNLNANSFLDLDRQGTVAANKTIAFGALTVGAGTQVLNTTYGQGDSIFGNNYIGAFTQVDGPGTLVKGGTRPVALNGYAGTFSGNLVVAGPQGLNLSTSGNLTLNAATNNINNLTVGGFQSFPTGKTVMIAGTLDVTNNAGQVVNGLYGVTNGNVTGTVSLVSGGNVTAGVVKNNGVIGANNSVATLTATTSIQGTGTYHAYGQNLTLDGNLANDGATPTTLKTVGTITADAVILKATASTNTGGAEVQNGTLRLSPTGGAATNPLGTGNIRVFGAPATTLAANSQPVATQNATLEFAGATISQAGNITNTGTIRASSGTTTLTGAISGTPSISSNLADFNAATVPGLLEGRYTTTAGLPDTNASGRDLTNVRQSNPGNFGVRLEPRMGQMNVVTQNGLTGWSNDTAWIYTGYFYDADGVFTFMENIDDSVLVSIDGVTRLLNNAGTNPWQTVTSTATDKGQRGTTLDTTVDNTGTPQGLTAIAANPNLPAGWHTIEMRFDNGGGGGGPVAGNGFAANYGLGLNTDGTMALDGTQASRPIDPGDGTLFRTAAAGKGEILVDSDATLNVGSFALTKKITLGGGAGAGAGVLTVTSAGSSSADEIYTTTSKQGQLSLPAGTTVTTSLLDVGENAQFTLIGAGRLTPTAITLQGSVGNTTGKATLTASGTNAVGALNSVTHAGSVTIINDNAAFAAPPLTGYTTSQRTYYATLDLRNNDLVVDNATPANDTSLANSQLSAITDMLRSGASSTGNLAVPDWQGKGISSSYVGTQGSLSGTMALGVMRNVVNPTAAFHGVTNPAAYGTDAGNAFNGLTTLAGNEILVKYTWYGDANLDGKLTSFDFALLDAGFAGTTQLDGSFGWFFGDFDYNGIIDTQDYASIVAGWTGYTTGGGPDSLPVNSQLPEPSTLLLGVLGLGGLLAAYRRRRQIGR